MFTPTNLLTEYTDVLCQLKGENKQSTATLTPPPPPPRYLERERGEEREGGEKREREMDR